MRQFCCLLLLVGGFLAPLCAQTTTPLNKFIERHQKDPGMTYAFLSKDIFEVVSNVEVEDKDWRQVQKTVKDFGSLRILAADSTTQGQVLYAEASRLIPSDFEELLTVRDDKDNVNIWIKDDETKITDLIILVGSEDAFVLVCFSGVFELSNFMSLASLFDAASTEQLAKITTSKSISFDVAPNPSSNGTFQLTYTDEKDEPSLVTVFDQNGRQVATRSWNGGNTQRLDLKDLPVGLYTLQLRTRAGKFGTKQVQIARP
jgi:hypothetical protein